MTKESLLKMAIVYARSNAYNQPLYVSFKDGNYTIGKKEGAIPFYYNTCVPGWACTLLSNINEWCEAVENAVLELEIKGNILFAREIKTYGDDISCNQIAIPLEDIVVELKKKMNIVYGKK